MRSKREFVVLDGKEGPRYLDIGGLRFSPDGKRLAYVGITEQGSHVVVDGKEGPGYEKVWDIKFFDESKRFLYRARKETRKHVVVVDGKEGPISDRINNFKFCTNDKRFMYVAYIEGKAHLIVDGEIGQSFIGIENPLFSPDSSKVVYWALKNEMNYCFIMNGKEVLTYDRMSDAKNRISRITKYTKLSHDGKNYAYVIVDSKKFYVVINGERGSEYDSIDFEGLTFAPDSDKIIYIAERNGKRFVIIDHKEIDSHDTISKPIFTKDGAMTYAYYDNSKGTIMLANVYFK